MSYSTQSYTPRLQMFLVLATLLILPGLSLAQTVTRGPYLQTATPTSIIVRWRTDVATDSKVGYAVLNGTPGSTADATVTTEHEVTLNLLSPDTLYNYTVGSTTLVLAGGDLNSNGDGEHFFTTSPVAGTEKSTRVWVIGDSGTADANAAAVRDAYKTFTGARGTDVWLMLGDNAYSIGSDAEYQAAVYDTYPQLLRQNPLWSAFGNHDAIDVFFNPPGAYPQIFSFPVAGESGGVSSGSEYFYSFDYGNIHFISLDSTTNTSRLPGSAMLSWLQSDLAANTQDWTIAFWHHPQYSKGSHDSDSEIVLIEMRENVVPLLEAYGVDLLLSGHSHSYERSYLLNGHHDVSTTLTPAMILDGGDGKVSGDGAYIKPGPAGTPNEGAVHVVIGSSGKLEGGLLNHPAMYASSNTLGSVVLDVSGNQLEAAFIDSTGAVQDEFTIIKSPPQVVDIDVDPWSPANIVKPSSNNPIVVALLGMSVSAGDAVDFDATQVNAASVRLGVGEAPNIALTPWIIDIDADSETDMLLAFDTQETGIFCDDTQVSLVGETIAGETFAGTDTIQASDCGDLGCHP